MAVKAVQTALRLSRDDSEYMNRTPGTATDLQTWTFSCWFKRGRNIVDGSGVDTILSAGSATTDKTFLAFDGSNRIQFQHTVASTVEIDYVSTAIFTDPTGWYHLVVAYDSNEGTAADRVKIWVNNVQLTQWDTQNTPSAAEETFINDNVINNIGRRAQDNDNYFDGYLAEMYMCDGQDLTPTTFAEANGSAWQPIDASPTFGGEGWELFFQTDIDLGDDTSGNTNDWTENNIAAANQREDTPTRNHLTLHPNYHGTGPTMTIENGMLEAHTTSGTINTVFATAMLPTTGKYYWEVDCTTVDAANRVTIGVCDQQGTVNNDVGSDNHGWSIVNNTGTTLSNRHDGSNTAFTDTGTLQTGDYVMLAYDAGTGELWFGLNGTWLDSGDPAAGTGETFTISDAFAGVVAPAMSVFTSGNQLTFRSAEQDWEGTAPTGFVSLDTSGWPTLAIEDPKDHFNVVAYSGNGTNPRSLTGENFQPEIAWVKAINQAGLHIISDTVIGAGTIQTHATGAADVATNSGGEITAFNADGITVDANTSDLDVNDNGVATDYIAAMWNESVTAGLDVVGYAGTASAQNIAHNLTVAPNALYVRNRDTAGNNALFFDRYLDTSGLPVTDPETDFMLFDTAGVRTDDATYWDDTAPDASNFRVGTNTSTNNNTDNHAAYVWAEVPGFSKFTAYRASNSTDTRAPFIYTNFRPALILLKNIDSTGGWRMWVRDNALIGANGGTTASDSWLADTDAAQATGPLIHICNSGFKLTAIDVSSNFFNREYLVMAFADVPFELASGSAGPPPPAGDGAIDMPLEITATGDNPNQYGDGAIDMPLEITATGDNPNQYGDGAPEIPLEITATGKNINRRGDGAIVMPMVVDGFGDYPGEFGFTDPHIDMPLEITSTASRNAKHGDGFIAMPLAFTAEGISGDDGGNITLPQLQTSGTVVQSFAMTGNPRIPRLQATGILSNPAPGFGSIRLPQLQVSGFVNADMNVDLPLLQVAGVMVPGRTLRALALNIPMLQVSGTGVNPVLWDGQLRLPQLQTSGILATSGVTDNSNIQLPKLEVSGFLFIPNIATGSIALPALDLDPLTFLAAGSIGGGSVTLPFQRVEGVIVNGVTLTGTVWVVNTETFETTNYSNYDFDSLVTYAEQPYGVTSGGIFLLAGDDDDGTQINANLLTGISDRGDENLKEVANMYMQGDYDSMMFQLYPDGQQRLREYTVDRRSNATGTIHGRAKGARGLRSRSWQMGLRNLSGGDFVIDKLGLLLRILTRKTRKN